MKAVVIGASTGGPRALEELLTNIPRDLPAILLIVQHMPGFFTSSMTKRWVQSLGREVLEVQTGDELQPGVIYVVPGDSHLFITSPNYATTLLPAKQKPHPSIDMVFTSVAEHFGPDTVGVILTGMGSDGTKGAQAIAQVGGTVLVQEPEEATIASMPQSVIDADLADKVLPLSKLARHITRAVA